MKYESLIISSITIRLIALQFGMHLHGRYAKMAVKFQNGRSLQMPKMMPFLQDNWILNQPPGYCGIFNSYWRSQSSLLLHFTHFQNIQTYKITPGGGHPFSEVGW